MNSRVQFQNRELRYIYYMIDYILHVIYAGQWANIALRWSTLQYHDQYSYIQLRSNEEFVGGLEVNKRQCT